MGAVLSLIPGARAATSAAVATQAFLEVVVDPFHS